MFKDLTGQKFGRLTVIEKAFKKNRTYFWWCLCECGNKKTVEGNKLKSKHTQSCGCFRKEFKIKHGYYKHPLYGKWIHMIERCYDKNQDSFKNYGGRGIKIYDEWKNNIEIFINWCLNNGWEPGLEIDRIDNNGNYEPSNCRFVTTKLNSRNRRSVILNESIVKDIKIRIKNGERNVDIANHYKISPHHVKDIKTKKSWTDINP
jgi:hypothetical protein